MIKDLTKFLVMVVFVFICLGIFSACSSGIWYKIGYGDQGCFGFKKESEGTKVGLASFANSVDELKGLCEGWNNYTYNENDEYYSSEIGQKIRTYDEVFFEKKALVIYSNIIAKPSDNFKVKNIKVDETKLLINISLIEKKVGVSVTSAVSWLFLIEVNKEDIIDVTKIEIIMK